MPLAQANPSPGLVDGITIPLVVSVVALMLNTVRDSVLRAREARRRDDAVMRLIDRELHANLLVLDSNLDAIRSVPASVDRHGAHVHIETQALRYCSRDGRDSINLHVPRRLRMDEQDRDAVYLAYWWGQRHDELIRTYEHLRLVRLLNRNSVTIDHLIHLRADVEHCLAMAQEVLQYLGVDTIIAEYAEESMTPTEIVAAVGDENWWLVPRLRSRRKWKRFRQDRPPPPYHAGTMEHRPSHSGASQAKAE